MKSYEFDIAIIGGGCIGSGILHELAQRGFRDVVLIDHGRRTTSATASSGGMLRVFHESPLHVELALAHHALLATYRRQGVFPIQESPNGSLYFFNKDRYREYEANLRKMDTAGYPFEVLRTANGRERFSQVRWNDEDWAIYEPLGSNIAPEKFVDDLLAASLRPGVSALDSFEVRRICAYRDRYRVSGDNGTVTAKSLILAGGARLLPRLRELGVHLPLEAKRLSAYRAKKTTSDFTLPNYFDRETLAFACLGVGEDVIFSSPTSSRLHDRHWSDDWRIQTADDCYAPQRLGFMGRVPGHSHLLLATGWGGTAFKFALEVGRRITHVLERDLPDRRMTYAQY